MKAGVWVGDEKMEYRDWPDPGIAPGMVLIRVAFCGFCGSDAHIISGTLKIGPPPQILGHEVSGVVEAIGDGVSNVSPGMKVACNLYGYCGACPWCAAGQPNHCRKKHFSAAGFAEYAVYQASQVFALPEATSLMEGALVEPIATCIHALDVSELRFGESVLVVGGGTLGQLLVQLARRAGAATVMLSEPMEQKRSLALELGADSALAPNEEELRHSARTVSPRKGYDVIFEAAGSISAVKVAPQLLADGGRLVIVGVFARVADVAISPFDFYEKEISMRGSFASLNSFPRAIAMVDLLHINQLITRTEPLDRISEIYGQHRAGDAVKLLVQAH